MFGRERVAKVLDRAGLFGWILSARKHLPRRILSVLCYHSVGEPEPGYLYDDAVIDATPAEFREHLRLLGQHFTVIDLDDLYGIMNGEPAPPNPLLISFDDGYRSCVDVALPILQELGFPATFFIATEYVDARLPYWWDAIHYLVKSSRRTRIDIAYPRAMQLEAGPDGDRQPMIRPLLKLVKSEHAMDLERFLGELAGASEVAWNREVKARIADDLIMTWDHVRTLRDAGMDVASHTRTHRVLQTLDAAELEKELVGSGADLERELGKVTRSVAYPVGYSIADHPEIRAAVAAAGYQLGFTNATGVNYLWQKPDPLQLRRIAMERGTAMAMVRGQLAVPVLGFARS